MGGKYPWSNLDDDQIQPGLDPNKFPRTDYITQRDWNDYWYNNPHGRIGWAPWELSVQTPTPVPWTGFSTNQDRKPKPDPVDPDPTPTAIKPATPDIEINNLEEKGLIKNKSLADRIEEFQQLFLTDIGGRELAVLSRHDQINGINQEYSPIKNLSDISLRYNPLEISPNADNVTTYLTSFNFDITKYIPTQQELDAEYPLEVDASKRAVVYFDKETSSLNVHVKNIFVNEKIEVEFIVPEEVKDGTIYT